MTGAIAKPHYSAFLVCVGAGVCVLSTLTGGFFGTLASVMYNLEIPRQPRPHLPAFYPWVGPGLGVISGFVVGLIWCRLMTRSATKAGVASLSRRGRHLGLLAGIVATLVVHVGLMIAEAVYKHFAWDFLLSPLIGMIFGIPAGYIVGAIGGSLYAFAFRKLAESGECITTGQGGRRPVDA